MGLQDNVTHPWTAAVLTVFLGLFVRGFGIWLGLEGDRSLDELFLRGQNGEYFATGGIALLIGLCFMAFGAFGFNRRRVDLGTPLHIYDLEQVRLRHLEMAAILGLVVSGVAFYAYVRATGGFDFDVISRKRTTIVHSNLRLDTTYRGLGWARVLNDIGFATACVWLYVRRRSNTFTLREAIRGAAYFGMPALLPFYSSNKANTVFVFIAASAILARTSRNDISWPRVAVLILGGLIALTFLTEARNSDSVDLRTITSPRATVDAVIQNRNFIEHAKTSHIIAAIPEVLPWQRGDTLFTYIFAPIPREWWPEKPLIAPGPLIGVRLYGHTRAGVPPGIVAEGYWNFHWFGVALLPFLLGITIAVANAGVVRNQGRMASIAFLVGGLRLPLTGLGATFGAATLEAFTTGLLLMVCSHTVVLVSSRRFQEKTVPLSTMGRLP